MKSTRLILLLVLPALLVTARLAQSHDLPVHQPGTDKKDRDDIAAVKYLGTVDCYWYPESQKVLLDTLVGDPREPVRYAAAQAIFDQLQRGRKPLKPLNGKREFPDPFILTQICRIATLTEPLTTAELAECYAERKMERDREKFPDRGDVQCGCSADAAIPVLLDVAGGKDEFYCFKEPSERVRRVASEALALVKEEVDLLRSKMTPTPADPLKPQPAPGTEPEIPPGTTQTQIPQIPEQPQFDPGRYLDRAPPVPIGRADTANRINFFDNQGATPRSRVYTAYQYVLSQNNAVVASTSLNELFANLSTASGQANFISFTGYGSGLGADGAAVTPNGSTASAQELQDRFTSFNTGTGVTTDFLLFPNSNIYRFGFEYALTPDFSFGMQGQYVQPLDDVEQPADFSNPYIQLKHVLYRGDQTLVSGALGIAPQIRHRRASIQENTSRLIPGLLFLHVLDDDRWILQGGTGFSLPTQTDQIYTWDYGLSIGRYLYRHESLVTGEPTDKFLLGIVPMFEVIGKEVIGRNDVRGAFGLNSNAPLTSPGTFSPVDGSRTVFLPQDPSRSFNSAAFLFEEPRHVVDLTAGTTFIFRNSTSLGLGVSFPVTGGAARSFEFISSLNVGF